MTTGEVLNKIKGLNKELLYYWEARGYIRPRKYQRGKVDKRIYNKDDFSMINAMFKHYKEGFPPKVAYEKVIEERRRTPIEVKAS